MKSLVKTVERPAVTALTMVTVTAVAMVTDTPVAMVPVTALTLAMVRAVATVTSTAVAMVTGPVGQRGKNVIVRENINLVLPAVDAENTRYGQDLGLLETMGLLQGDLNFLPQNSKARLSRVFLEEYFISWIKF